MKFTIERAKLAAVRVWVGRVVTALLAAALLLFSNPASAAELSPGLQDKLDEIAARGETGRPRTTRQWEEEAEELQGKPIERFDRVIEESVEAVGEMVEMYPDALNLEEGDDSSNAEGRDR